MQGRKIITESKNESVISKLQAYFVGFCYDGVNFLFWLFSLICWPKKIEFPKKICIYRIGNIGDIICAIPAFIAIRKIYPEAHITLLTSPGPRDKVGAKELFTNPWFFDALEVYYGDEIKSVQGIKKLVKKLQEQSFDLIIYLPHDMIYLKTLFRNFLFLKMCKAKKVVGFELSVIRFWTQAQSKFFQFDNEVERLLKLLVRWGVKTDTVIEYDFPISEETKQSVLQILIGKNINKDAIIGIMPGASHRENQWSLDNFSIVVSYILRKFPNHQVLIFGGSDDYEKGEYIKRFVNNDLVINLCGVTSLVETIFLVSYLKFLVSCNTGLMHIAALAGKKVIAIFSSAELNGKWFPYSLSAKVLLKRNSKKCDGFYYRNFLGSEQCINAIVAEDVIQEINLL